MLLTTVVQDDTMAVPGFEHHTFMCSACHDVEERLVFTKPLEQRAQPVPMHAAPPVAPASAVETPGSPVTVIDHKHAAAPSLVRRMFERLLSDYRH